VTFLFLHLKLKITHVTSTCALRVR